MGVPQIHGHVGFKNIRGQRHVCDYLVGRPVLASSCEGIFFQDIQAGAYQVVHGTGEQWNIEDGRCIHANQVAQGDPRPAFGLVGMWDRGVSFCPYASLNSQLRAFR